MVNIERSYPEPEALAEEKKKVNGKPNETTILERLQTDFKNKCYICEQTSLASGITVEHFVPHRNNKELKFQWENLFFSCSHCNSVKSIKYNTNDDNEILNCTNPNHDVVRWIKYEYDISYKCSVKLTADGIDKEYKKVIDNTVKLLTEVYCGNLSTQKSKTANLKLEAANLRKSLENNLICFEMSLQEYEQSMYFDEKKQCIKKIITELKKDSAFTAFKRWIIMKSKYRLIFEDYFD
ncbi:HNH endonuclease [Candidatus Magnetobacterium bavaricum]|uniref:HNH endonuclease n=1 Tax=Candidatus Magnetobacterium bavaricum TaxID=29290 RepID=A0A0F3GR06_9BACT|nr:HNH endonuclease [Candidatus Magnetobacterium bavaricum]